MKDLTEKQWQALRGIVESEYGDVPTDWKWTWSCNNFDNARSFGGVIASLKKRGLVNVLHATHLKGHPRAGQRYRKDDCLALTELGLAVWTEKQEKIAHDWTRAAA